jgi:hypothetical protein
MMGDPNMDTALEWSKEFIGLASLPPDIERDRIKLLEIVQAVGDCVGHEFEEDKKTFEREHGHPPSQDELPYIHPAFSSYEKERKNKFIDCIKEKTRSLVEMDDNSRIKISLQLWSGCMMTSKEISARTQFGQNTPESRRKQFEEIINPRADAYSVFKVGEKISPFFKRKVGQGNDVFFDGIPAGSAVLEVKDEFNNTRSKDDSMNSK